MSTRVKGHGLRAEGKAFELGSGGQWSLSPWVFEGVGVCSCGATSERLFSDNARKKWHRQHKLDVTAAVRRVAPVRDAEGPQNATEGRAAMSEPTGDEIAQAERIRRRATRIGGMWMPAPLIDPFRRCPHLHQRGIYGDEIITAGWKRARCYDCGRLLPNLPPKEAVERWIRRD